MRTIQDRQYSFNHLQVDHLYTKNQTILYNMLEWPQQGYSKLIVIAIANTLDLPETMFKKKLQSRLVR